jgi:hypothetical protein
MSIRAELKSLICSDFDMRVYVPETPDTFAFWVEMEIGPLGQEGSDLFQVLVCTPRWLEKEVHKWGSQWSRGKLVVNSYSFDELKNFLSRTIGSIEGRDWAEVSSKIRLLAEWEFEGYA